MKNQQDIPITVTFRHMDATAALQAYAEKKVQPVANSGGSIDLF